jgi:hypothetical protein
MEEGRRNSPKKKVPTMAGTSCDMRNPSVDSLISMSSREMMWGRKEEGKWFMGEGERPGVVDDAHL